LSPRGRGFCIEQPAISAPWSPVKKFTILTIEDPNTINSELVDALLLYYKTHSERMLLAISRLGKQSLILGYNWLKDHNPKIDWEKGEVEMTCCLLQCEGECTLWKEQTYQKRIELQAL